MLFNSYVFLFLFLPATLAGFQLLLLRNRRELAFLWLVVASLFFYGWWNPAYVWLILGSMGINYTIGRRLAIQAVSGAPPSRLLLTSGITFNLVLLAYYKYANFFLDNINHLVGSDIQVGAIVLPLAISFFTFQQIAYLVDAYRGETAEYSPLHYALFITFFPQLIAGPIVHHKEMMPQFGATLGTTSQWSNIAEGLTIVAIGLFKKVVLADSIAVHATPVFEAAAQGESLGFFAAWSGALAYTFQLYFDFSGYADMAIGAALMFGVRLPLNFDSPYKSVNIIDFWRRWHMTLSRFLRDYLYIALGGNRKGRSRRYVNLMATMVLGGLWHGAGWTFLIWGGLHGLYLVCNHFWRHLRSTLLGHDLKQSTWIGRGAAWFVTFIAVVVAWVFFRAASLSAAIEMLKAMFGFNGIGLAPVYETFFRHLKGGDVAGMKRDLIAAYFNDLMPTNLVLILILAVIAFAFPSTQEYLRYRRQPPAGWIAWRPNGRHALLASVFFMMSVASMNKVSEFLYFQF